VSSIVAASNRGLLSTALLTSLNGMPWQNFSKSTVVHAKMSDVNPITPLLEVILICRPFGMT